MDIKNTKYLLCNDHLIEAVNLAEKLLALADRGDESREDVGCGVLYGMIRDCGYKLRSLAEAEIAEHQRRGIWSSALATHKE